MRWLVERFFDGYNRRDLDGVLELFNFDRSRDGRSAFQYYDDVAGFISDIRDKTAMEEYLRARFAAEDHFSVSRIEDWPRGAARRGALTAGFTRTWYENGEVVRGQGNAKLVCDEGKLHGVVQSVQLPPRVANGWDGRVEVDFETGAVRAAGFNELIEREQPEWAESVAQAVQVMLRLDEPREERVDLEEQIDEQQRPVVVATRSELRDDSINAIRHRLTFERADDGLVRFVSGIWSQRCQPGRGQQEFESKPCT